MPTRDCPVCHEPTLRVDTNNYYACPCGSRIHEAFLHPRESIGPNPEPHEPPLPKTRKEAATMAHDMVMSATEIIERLHEAGLIAGNPDHLRQAIAEAAEDAVWDNWI